MNGVMCKECLQRVLVVQLQINHRGYCSLTCTHARGQNLSVDTTVIQSAAAGIALAGYIHVDCMYVCTYNMYKVGLTASGATLRTYVVMQQQEWRKDSTTSSRSSC